jgi:hypothetical protein
MAIAIPDERLRRPGFWLPNETSPPMSEPGRFKIVQDIAPHPSRSSHRLNSPRRRRATIREAVGR